MEHQGRVLKWGIAGAILMRGIMIVFGVAVSPLPAPQSVVTFCPIALSLLYPFFVLPYFVVKYYIS